MSRHKVGLAQVLKLCYCCWFYFFVSLVFGSGGRGGDDSLGFGFSFLEWEEKENGKNSGT